MRIAFVAPGGFDRSGRDHVVPVLLSLVERLARRHQVVVYVLRYHDRPCSYSLLGATIRDLGRPRGVWRQYRAVAGAMRRDGPFDVIHGYWALPSGLVAALCGRRFGVPAVATCDSGEFVALPEIGYGSQQTWRQRLGVKATARLARRLTACSGYQARLAGHLGITADVLPIAPDSDRFVPALRAEGPPWRLLSIARLHPVKDPGALVATLHGLRQRQVDAELDVVGEDTMSGTIGRMARELGVGAHVRFHGFVPNDDLVSFYRRAHLLVMPSLHEAGPVTALEAALCGVPIVGTAVGFVADWAPERAAAVQSRRPAALVEVVQALLDDPDRRARMADAARQWALVHDASWSATELERLYAALRTVTPGS